MNTLTKENARDGMTIRLSRIEGSTHRTLIRDHLNQRWVVKYDADPTCIPDEWLFRWIIVEDAPEPALVSLDPQNPPELPIDHPDAPQRTLQANSVKTEPVEPEALAYVDEVISILEIVTNRTMPQTVDPKLLKQALEFQYQLKGLLELGPVSETPGQKMDRVLKLLTCVNDRLIIEHNERYGTGEVQDA